MNDENSRLLLATLKEISDNQQLQLALQREQFAWVQRQAERHEVIHDRAENIQAKSAQMMAVALSSLDVKHRAMSDPWHFKQRLSLSCHGTFGYEPAGVLSHSLLAKKEE
jgi:hypothetical protein